MDKQLRELIERQTKLQLRIVEKSREYAGADAESQAELGAALDGMIADREALEEKIGRIRAANGGAQFHLVREDQPLVGRGGSRRALTLEDIPTPADLARRDRLLRRALGGERLSDEQTSEAYREYPVERLMWKRAGQVLSADRSEFTEEEDAAWAQYQANLQAFDKGSQAAQAAPVNQRAYSNVLNLTDGSGGEAVPTLLESMFWPRVFSYAARPNAVDGNFTVRRLPFMSNLDVPLLGGTPAWAEIAAAADGTTQRPTTSKHSFAAVKYGAHVPIAQEHLIGGGATNLEQAVLEWIAEGYARTINAAVTNGAADKSVKGIVTRAPTGHTTASGTAVSLADVRAFIRGLGEDIIDDGTAMVQTRLATEAVIAGLITESVRDFNISREGRVILPYGVGIPQWNVDIDAIPAAAGAGNHVMVAGLFRHYAKVYVGGMRFGRFYDQLSDTTLLSFFQIQAGDVVRTEAFSRLTMKSS